jgi:hypothetical protein
MNLISSLLSVLQFFSGVAGVFVDPKNAKRRWVFLGLLSCTLLGTVINDSIKNRQVDEDRLKVLESYKQLQEDNRRLEGHLLTLLAGLGYTKKEITEEEISRSIAADKGLTNLRQTTAESSSNVRVEYVVKDANTRAITEVLNGLGFQLQIKKPVNDYPTNAMWIGDQVTLEDAKKIALALIRAGVEIRRISRFPVESTNNASLIQVGADPALVAKPILTVEQVLALQELKSSL